MFATGPFSICQVSYAEDSDSAVYTTLKWGYDTLEEARAAMEHVAFEEAVPLEDVIVIEEHRASLDQE